MAMYNRYIPSGASYTRVTVDEDAASAASPPHQDALPTPDEEKEEKKGLASLLKSLKLDGLDTGDILLLLILLFLFLEGDDMELIITLGLVLLLGLD